MGDVITACRETFVRWLSGGKAVNIEPGPTVGRPAALMVLCSGCGAAFALSFAPDGRYVQCGEAAVVRGRRSCFSCCRIPTHRALSLPSPACREDRERLRHRGRSHEEARHLRCWRDRVLISRPRL